MSKPIRIIITDTHLSEDNFEQNELIFNQVIKLAKELNIKEVYHLGDFFTNRASQKLETILSFIKLLDLFKDAGMILSGIPGNHDKSDQTINQSWLDVFSGHENFSVINDLQTRIFKKFNLHFLPYYREDIYNQKLQSCEIFSGVNILLTHQGIDGVLDNDGVKITSSLTKKGFAKFDKVLIGHYHNRMRVGRSIEYIGSTDARNFGEDNEKGCVLLHDDGEIEFVNLEFRNFITIKISENEIANIYEILESYKGSEDRIRLEVTGSKIELSKIDKKEINNLGFEIVTKDTEFISEESNNVSQNLDMGRKELRKHFIEYCETKKIEKKEYVQILKKL